MKVTELIEKLVKCPPFAEVFVGDGESGPCDDPCVYLMDAWEGEPYPGAARRVEVERGRNEPNCKAVIISHWAEDGERL